MKLLTWIGLIVILRLGCGFSLMDATSQQWVGGLQESGFGTDFTISLKTRLSSDDLQIDQLWVGDVKFEIQAVKDLANRRSTEYGKRDTLFVRAGIKYVSTNLGETKLMTGELIPPPKQHKGAALLGYLYKGKRKYKVIKEFRVLEKIIYP